MLARVCCQVWRAELKLKGGGGGGGRGLWRGGMGC